jgi:signal peptidase I
MRWRIHGKIRVSIWLGAVVVAVAVAWITKLGTRWPSVYYMTGPSMEPTVAAEEYFLAWSPTGQLSQGDLVLFRYEDEDGVFHVLRRLVALPNDTVLMDSGAVVVNGMRQRWPFQILKPSASYSVLALEGNLYDWGPWVVPADSAVLLADTRDMLGWPDSRFVGFIALTDIPARATRTVSGRRLR